MGLAACALLLAGCGEQESAAPEGEVEGPVVLIGVDGLEWNVALPLLREGRMPHLARLMERGSYGKLQTMQPTKSPVIWTTIATGKPPAQHGILDFAKPEEPGMPRELYSNLDRRTKAVWNIAGEHGKRVAIVGWWMTFPAEPVEGVMVAQTNTAGQLDAAGGKNIWKGRLIEGVAGQVWPPERASDVMARLAASDATLDDRLRELFGEFPHPLTALDERLWDNCRWAFRADATYLSLAEGLLEDPERFDLLAVYFGGPDVVGHRFWRYFRPKGFAHPPSQEQIDNLGSIIEDYYTWIDGAIGALVARAGASARILVVSDHGMGPVNQDKAFDPHDPPDFVNSGHHLSAPPGVVVAAGPGLARQGRAVPVSELRRSDVPKLASIFELAPTVLALLDVPIGRDLESQPSVALIRPERLQEKPLRWVDTHDTEEWLREHRTRQAVDPGEAERVEQLRELGYIESE